MTYLRATDPFPLESAEHTKLHEFYTRLAQGRLCTTQCRACRTVAWPPRALCAECAADGFDWIELPQEGVIHAFTVQEVGLPAGFAGPRVFAIVKIDGHRLFSIVRDVEPAQVRIGQRVRLAPLRVADGPEGSARWLPAFVPA